MWRLFTTEKTTALYYPTEIGKSEYIALCYCVNIYCIYMCSSQHNQKTIGKLSEKKQSAVLIYKFISVGRYVVILTVLLDFYITAVLLSLFPFYIHIMWFIILSQWMYLIIGLLVKVNTEGVFVATGSDTEIGGLFLRLKTVMVSELHLQWDLVFLEQYVSEHMVPQSLRWDVSPQHGDTDLDSWYKYLYEASITFLSFLITRKRNRLSVLGREIKELKNGPLIYKNSSEYNFLSSDLQAHLIKEDRDQRNKKHKKYTRDIGDYKSGTVFGLQKQHSTDSSLEVGASSGQQNRDTNTKNQTMSSTRSPSAYTNKVQSSRDGPPPPRGCHLSVHSGSPGRYYNYPSSHTNSFQYNHPHISMYNRFSPLRDHYNDGTHGYPNGNYDQSPYGYNQSNPNSQSSQVSYKDTQGRKRGTDVREVPEKGGGVNGGKRRRT